jgi:hypothetical protein
MKRITVLALAILMSACGSDAPTAPSVVQVAGTWTGTLTQVSATGDQECLARFQQTNGASDRYTMSITQSGIEVDGTATSQATGLTCDYKGIAHTTTVELATKVCRPIGVPATCNLLPRDVVVVGHILTGTVSGNTIQGTTQQSWTVFPRGASNVIGAITVNNTFTFTRQ